MEPTSITPSSAPTHHKHPGLTDIIFGLFARIGIASLTGIALFFYILFVPVSLGGAHGSTSEYVGVGAIIYGLLGGSVAFLVLLISALVFRLARRRERLWVSLII